jgi:hypothetical protein
MLSFGWTVLTALLAGGGAFIGGWIIATEKVRLEVFKRRFEVYQEINKRAANLLVLNVEAEFYPDKMREVVKARIALADWLAVNAMIVSPNVGICANGLTPDDSMPNTAHAQAGFNKLIATMATELRLNAMHFVTDSLSNPVSALERLKRQAN